MGNSNAEKTSYPIEQIAEAAGWVKYERVVGTTWLKPDGNEVLRLPNFYLPSENWRVQEAVERIIRAKGFDYVLWFEAGLCWMRWGKAKRDDPHDGDCILGWFPKTRAYIEALMKLKEVPSGH